MIWWNYWRSQCDAKCPQANITQAIQDRRADYLLVVKDNQPTLADAMHDFFIQFQAVHHP